MEDVETWEKKNKRKERRGEQSEWEVGWKRSKTFPRGKTKNEMKSAMKKEKMMKSWTKLQNYDDRMLMKIRTEPIFPVGIVEADVRTVDRRHFFFILTSSQKAMNLFIYFFFLFELLRLPQQPPKGTKLSNATKLHFYSVLISKGFLSIKSQRFQYSKQKVVILEQSQS